MKGRECYQTVDTCISIFYEEVNEKCLFEHCTQCSINLNGCRNLCKIFNYYTLVGLINVLMNLFE